MLLPEVWGERTVADDVEAEDAIDDVLDVITGFYGVRLIDVLSQRRSSQLHNARCMGMYLAQKAGAGARQIGRRFGGRDHTIVEAVCQNMAREATDNVLQAALVRDLEVMREAVAQKRRLFKSPRH